MSTTEPSSSNLQRNGPVVPAPGSRIPPAPTPTVAPRRVPELHAGAARRALRVIVIVVVTLIVGVVGVLYPLFARGAELIAASWQAGWALFALVLVPFVFWRATFGEDRRSPRLLLGTIGPLPSGPSGWRVWFRDVPGVLRTFGLAFLIVAMARPVNTLQPQSADEEGIDIVLVLDLSGSMQAVMDNMPQDLAHLEPTRARVTRPTRLDAAKAVIRDFISRRKTDRIGVVVFGKEAYVLSPPTLDYHLLDTLVSRMDLKLIDGSATAIGDALGVAVARLRHSHARSKAVILLTDGDNNAGRIAPEYAAHLANVVNARVYSIQIGSGEMAEVQDGFDVFGQPRYVTVPFPVNPLLLRQLSEKTNGATYVATDARALQASFHDVLNKLEKTKFEASTASYEELYSFLLLPGVLLISIEALVRSLLLRRFP